MKKSVFTAEYESLRQELVKARKRAEFTQRQLAHRLDVTRSWVAKVELGDRRIDVIEFCWFLAACNADPLSALRFVAKSCAARTFRPIED